MKDKIEELLSGIKPILAMQEKDVVIVEASDERVLLQLKGFCNDCGCSMSYVDGITDMITHQFPQVKEVRCDMGDAA